MFERAPHKPSCAAPVPPPKAAGPSQRVNPAWFDLGMRHHEREADRVADHIDAGSPAPKISSLAGTGAVAQAKSEAAGSEHAQPLAAPALAERGRPLAPEVQAHFETRLGQDFGDVRIHTDGRADESARAMRARAYTHGHDLVFRHGAYAPETRAGRKLLAHELAHVVQQRGGAPVVQRQLEDPAEAPSSEPDTDAEQLQNAPARPRNLLSRRTITSNAIRWVSPEFRRIDPGRIVVETRLSYSTLPVDCRPDNNQYYVTLRGTTNSGNAYSETKWLDVGTAASNIFDIAERGNYQAEVGIQGGCADLPFALVVKVDWRP